MSESSVMASTAESVGPAFAAAPAISAVVPALLHFCARQWARHELLVFDDQRLGYAEAEQRSAVLARQLMAAGIGKGSRVCLLFPNDPRFVIVWLAVVRIGAIAIPISTLSSAAELQRVLAHADAQLLIGADRYLGHDYLSRLEEALPGLAGQPPGALRLPAAPHLRAVWIWGTAAPAWAHRLDAGTVPADTSEALLAAAEASVSPADPVSIIYTSGSTGDPKGVVHSHGNFVRQASKLVANHYPPFAPDERVFSQQPFFWVGGLVFTLLNLMLRGATCLFSTRSGAALLDFLQQERVTYLHGWRHMACMLAADPSFSGRSFPHMRGGKLYEALPPDMRPHDEGLVGTALGMTETCGPYAAEQRLLPESLRGSFGMPLPGMQHRLVDPGTGRDAAPGEPGEMWVRGDTLMLGLVRREAYEVFEPGGWYRTGDMVSLREGHFFFHGRLDDMIKTAGANVSPREVEQALLRHGAVSQAFVFGVPDPLRHAVVAAIVVPAAGAEIDAAEVRRQAGAELSSFKVPRAVLVMQAADLPMTSSGKTDRRRMRDLLERAHAQAAAVPPSPASR